MGNISTDEGTSDWGMKHIVTFRAFLSEVLSVLSAAVAADPDSVLKVTERSRQNHSLSLILVLYTVETKTA
jgi:hypothetical protein